MTQTQARLVILDPIVSFLDSSVHDSSNQDVRRALLPLAVLAEKHQAAILFIRHLNKRGSGRSLYRGLGSIGFLGACRSGWLVAADPTDPARRVLAQLKNNLAAPQPSLAFSVQPCAGGGVDLCWLGTSPLSADDLLAGRRAGKVPTTALKDARAFLSDFLRNGPRTSHEIWNAALNRWLSKRTLFRARRDLAIRVKCVWQGLKKSNYWLLPGQTLPQFGPLPDPFAEMQSYFEALEAQFPPPTPLDEE